MVIYGYVMKLKIIFLCFYIFFVNVGHAVIVKPSKLRSGDMVALISPGYKVTPKEVAFSIERIKALGLEPVVSSSVLEQDGCYGGTIESRAKEINDAFLNPKIKAIIAVRGGAGSFQLLDHIDYKAIEKNPKIFIGFSDITALLIGIYNKTGLITFHGPMPSLVMTSFSVDYLQKIVMQNEKVLFENIKEKGDDLIQTEYRITTINPGIAKGRIIGGNLTLLTNLIGSNYLPTNAKEWRNKILFVEEITEDIYKIDRMLSQLQKANILSNISGFVFGLCTGCSAGYMNSVSLEETLQKYFKNLKIPVFSGAMIGHGDKIFTIPIGVSVEINANKGTIKMLEEAIKV
jgi:muramoyltetrapeptide carboxypeptidase